MLKVVLLSTALLALSPPGYADCASGGEHDPRPTRNFTSAASLAYRKLHSHRRQHLDRADCGVSPLSEIDKLVSEKQEVAEIYWIPATATEKDIVENPLRDLQLVSAVPQLGSQSAATNYRSADQLWRRPLLYGVPEPGPWLLMLVGFGWLGLAARAGHSRARRRRLPSSLETSVQCAPARTRAPD